MSYFRLFKALAFQMPAETAHTSTLEALALAIRWGYGQKVAQALVQQAPVHLAGLTFHNRIGLAAGMDKNGDIGYGWAHLGFGFAELGTVTPKPQPGNPRPRLFRLPKDTALINRMGFNNAGASAMAKQLAGQGRVPGFVLGGNLGKQKETPLHEALNDYRQGMEALEGQVDYYTINLSSPNTPGLRDLQDPASAYALIKGLLDFQKEKGWVNRPVFVKIAPDMEDAQHEELCKGLLEGGASGIIATNTTLSRAGLRTPIKTVENIGQGGLSGRPLFDMACEKVAKTRTFVGPAFPLIGVGGIMSVEQALAMRAAGADLLQIYSGLVFHGPALVKDIAHALESHATLSPKNEKTKK